MATVHIVPRGLEGWLLKVEGEKINDGYFATREEALRVKRTERSRRDGQSDCDLMEAGRLR